jgi:multidrug resistance efflux pump
VRVVELDSLTDSRIQYEKRPPFFGLLILALTTVAIVGVVSWASVTKRPSVVEGSGAIEGANRTMVMSSVSGRVVEVAAPNGATVESGDRIIAVESVELEVEKQTVASQKALLEHQLGLQTRFTAAIRSKKNVFRQDVPEESTFYWKFESLQNQKKQLRVDRPSLEALGYTPEEIANAIAQNKLKAEEIDSTALSESAEKETALRQEIGEIDIRGQAAATGEGAFQVAAPVAGTVYLDELVQVGSVVNAGDPIGSVASTASGIDVKVYLSVPDRQNVEVGDRATVSVSGLPAVDYEKLTGRIVSIDADVTAVPVGDAETANYFVAHLALEQEFVTIRGGDRHDLVNGTAISVDLVHHEITYLEYFVELLGLQS